MIRLENVSKMYGNETLAVRDASFDVAKGDFVFLVGPSGSGKSTLLRLVNRQERPERGNVYVAGRDINELPNSQIPHLRRTMGNVFQDYKLLPNKTVFENVAFALEVIGKPKHVIGMHILARYVTGYGGKVAPPFNRFFMGGENDIRGFQLYTVSPVAFIPVASTVAQLNNDGSVRQQRCSVLSSTCQPNSDQKCCFEAVTQQIPAYQMVFPGGDTNIVSNFEYRIPIFGPLTMAFFFVVDVILQYGERLLIGGA